MPPTRADDLALAQRAALAGAALGAEYFRRVQELAIEKKADGSLVTEADRHVEQTVRGILLAERPEDACLGEETGASPPGRRRWILDGIDGTADFVRADPSWSTLIALEEDGQLTVSIVSVPAQGRMWWAVRGEGACAAQIQDGALLRPTRLHASPSQAALAGCRLGIVPRYAALSPFYRNVVDGLVEVAMDTPWLVHPALLVASGELDVAVQLEGKVWDFAAPALVVEAAGGVFLGATGGGHPHQGHAIYAATPALATQALALLR